MRLKRLLAVPLSALLLMSTAYGADVPDEQFDGFKAIENQHPASAGAKYYGAYFTDSGWRAIQGPSFLMNEDASVSAPYCSSVEECQGHNLLMDANLAFCKNSSETNCIQNIVATDSKKVKHNYTNQRYFPAAQELVFKGDVSSHAPNGSTPSVVQFPNLPNGAGTVDYAIGAYVISRFKTTAAGTSQSIDPLFLASIVPVQIVKGNYVPRIAIKNENGQDVEALSREENCAVVEIGMCGLPVAFPEGATFTLTLRLNQTFYGWLHGRLAGSNFVNTDLGNGNYLVEISGAPNKVPDVIAAVQAELLPVEIRKQAFGEMSDPAKTDIKYFPSTAVFASRGKYAYDNFVNWLPYMSDKAAAMPGVWSVRNIQQNQVIASAGDHALSCLINGSTKSANNGIVGFLNTNATSYMSGPPTFNAKEQALEYKLAAPHLSKDGTPFQGMYTLQIREDVARCIFSLTNAPVKATVSIASGDGTVQVAATSMRQLNGFFYFQASGFHFSAPVIKIKMQNLSASSTSQTKKPISIFCIKGKTKQKVQGVNPKCPAGYKKA